MVVSTFESIFEKARREGITNKVREAVSWYRSAAAKTRVNATQLIQEDVKRLQSNINQYSIGRMYMFYYDAKWKNTKKLPYWDRYPMIFPVDLHPGGKGFYGINFHYLPPQQRARLLDGLDAIKNNKKYDNTTRLNISYRFLKAASNLRLFKPCFKLYLFNHVRSKYMYVNPNEWGIAIFLPVARFEGATQAQVYRDSLKMVKGQ